MKIERARPEHAYDIAVVQVETWRAAYGSMLSESAFENMTVEIRAIRWGEILLNPLGPTFVAIIDGAVVGFVSGGPNRDELADEVAELYALYVTQEFWGTGVGEALMEHISRAYFRPFDAVTLWVLRENSRAIRFYKKIGFALDGEEKLIVFGDDSVPERRMRRETRTATSESE